MVVLSKARNVFVRRTRGLLVGIPLEARMYARFICVALCGPRRCNGLITHAGIPSITNRQLRLEILFPTYCRTEHSFPLKRNCVTSKIFSMNYVRNVACSRILIVTRWFLLPIRQGHMIYAIVNQSYITHWTNQLNLETQITAAYMIMFISRRMPSSVLWEATPSGSFKNRRLGGTIAPIIGAKRICELGSFSW
jgi:hypothetical protein